MTAEFYPADWLEAAAECFVIAEPRQTSSEISDQPFRSLVAGFVEKFRADLTRHSLKCRIGEGTAETLKSRFCRRLHNLFAPTFYGDFMAFSEAAGGGGAANLHERWIKSLHGSRRKQLIETFPLLFRFAYNLASSDLKYATDLVHRLAADASILKARLGVGARPEALVGIDAGLSDPHAGGATVARLRFEDGSTLIYKPRTLRNDEVVASIVTQFPEPFAGRIRVPEVWDRGCYGWARDIVLAPSEDPGNREVDLAAAAAFAYLLSGTDLHTENVRFARDGVWLFDAETIMQGITAFHVHAGRTHPAVVWNVLSSELLPTRFSLDPFKSRAGALGERANFAPYRRFRFVTSEQAGVRLEFLENMPGDAEARAHAGPSFERVDPERVAALFASVLTSAATVHNPILWHATNCSSGMRVRVLLRDTALYDRILVKRCLPDYLRDAALLYADVSALRLSSGGSPGTTDAERAICLSEVRQTLAGDVPLFFRHAESTDLEDHRGVVAPGFFRRSASADLGQKFAALSQQEIAGQTSLLRCALAASQEFGRDDPRYDCGHYFNQAAFIDHLFTFIDGDLAPFARFSPGPDGSVFVPELSDEGLYSGRLGLLLALELALVALPNEEIASSQVLSAYAADRNRVLEAQLDRSLSAARCVGMDGIAAVLLVAAAAVRSADDAARVPRLLADVRSRVHAVGSGDVDYMQGDAGLVCGLSALLRAVDPDSLPSTVTAWCADAAAMAVERVRGHLLNPDELLGFSHGLAGYGCALSRAASLFLRLGRKPLIVGHDAALIAERFRSEWRDSLDGWRDLRYPGQDVACGASWCHGLAGIAYFKLSHPRLKIGRSLGWIVERLWGHLETESLPEFYCCGEAGVLDLLLECSRRGVVDAEMCGRTIARIEEKAGRILRAKRFRGKTPGTSTVTWPGLFQGALGIVHLLNRTRHPRFAGIIAA